MSLDLTIIDESLYLDEKQRPVLQVCMEMSETMRRTLAEKTGEPVDTTPLTRIFHFKGYWLNEHLRVLVSHNDTSNKNWMLIESLCEEMYTRWNIWLLFKENARLNSRTAFQMPMYYGTFYMVVPENRYDTFMMTIKRFIDKSVMYQKNEANRQKAIRPYVRDEWLDIPLEDAINQAIDRRDEETFKQLTAAYNALQRTLNTVSHN